MMTIAAAAKAGAVCVILLSPDVPFCETPDGNTLLCFKKEKRCLTLREVSRRNPDLLMRELYAADRDHRCDGPARYDAMRAGDLSGQSPTHACKGD